MNKPKTNNFTVYGGSYKRIKTEEHTSWWFFPNASPPYEIKEREHIYNLEQVYHLTN